MNTLKMKGQRWLSILLVIAMIFSWTPTSIHAEVQATEALTDVEETIETNDESEENTAEQKSKADGEEQQPAVEDETLDKDGTLDKDVESSKEDNNQSNSKESDEDQKQIEHKKKISKEKSKDLEDKQESKKIGQENDNTVEEESDGEKLETAEENENKNIDPENLIEEAIIKTKSYYEQNTPRYSENSKGFHSDYWVFSALWGAGYKDLQNDFPWESHESSPWADYTFWSEGLDSETSTSNEDAGVIIGSLLLGNNPYQFGKQNIVEDLIEKQKADGSFFTINAESWAMIALDLMDADYNQDKHIEYILSKQNEKGMFGEADATGWILTALAPHKEERKDVKKAVNKAVNYIHTHYKENNKVAGQKWGENSNSIASVIMGLAANGEDLTSEKWTNDNSSLIGELINDYQQKDGSFKWQKNNSFGIEMATEQVLLALATVNQGQSIFEQLNAEKEIPAHPNVDKSKLEQAISKAKEISTEGKTIESIKELNEALAAGKSVQEDAESTQDEVDKAVDAIQTSIKGLENLTVNKGTLADLIGEANAVDLDEQTDKSAKDLQATLKEAEMVFADADATQNEVDQVTQSLKKAISNLKERAPPVTVNVRVETHEKTLVPTTEFTVESFDLMEYINGNNGGKSVLLDSPRAVHAIIQALETVEGLDPKDDNDFGLGSGGNYIHNIGEDQELGGPVGMSGWMYFIDNGFADRGILDREINNGESIVLYYTENFMDNTFSWFDSESYSTTVDEPLEIELTGDQNTTLAPVTGATILVNEDEYEVDNEVVLTGEDGKATLIFDETGTYHLSANRLGDYDERNIVRPYAVVEVSEGENDEGEPEDTEAPIITVDGIKTGQKVTKDRVNFTVEAKDKVDGIVDATVTLNEKVVKPNKAGKFNVQLNEGENTIVVKATDKSENIATKEYTITYKPIESKYDLEIVIDKTAEYIFSNGIDSAWEAVGLVRAGKKLPSSYKKKLNDTIKNEITNGLKEGDFKITDAERLAIATAVIGKDPQEINGHNLIELIYNSPDRKLWDDSVVDTMTYQGNNGLAFALIALDTKNFTVPEDAKWSRQAIIDELLKNQLDDGSWSLNELYDETSIDVTSMALTGLAPYKNQEKVKEALDKAVNYLSKAQVDEGGFDGGSTVGGITSEATAQVIIALTAYGIDPTSKQFTKDGSNLIDHLLSYQTDAGGFTHSHNYADVDEMATEQALQALSAYQLFFKGEDRLYNFDSIKGQQDKVLELGDEKVPVEKGDKLIIKDKGSKVSKASVTLPDDLPEGTKVTVTVPNKKNTPYEEDKMELAGDWFDFDFEYPEGNEDYEGVFELTLTVDKGTDFKKTEIYHYNKSDNVWELIEGTKDRENRTITVEVKHFSVYGVFINTEEEESEDDKVDPENPDKEQEDPEGDSDDDTIDSNKDDTNGSGEGMSDDNTDNANGQPSADNKEDGTSSLEKVESSGKNGDNTLNIVSPAKEDEVATSSLPSTSTNIFNIILVGFVLLVLGSVALYARKRTVIKNK